MNTTLRRSSMKKEEVVVTNTWCSGLATLKVMIYGFLNVDWSIVKHWTSGGLVRQKECGSFFPLGFLMHPLFG